MSKYVIINASVVPSVNFAEVKETSEDTLRWNVAATDTVVKFDGSTPSFLDGLAQYTHTEILEIMATAAWSSDPPE